MAFFVTLDEESGKADRVLRPRALFTRFDRRARRRRSPPPPPWPSASSTSVAGGLRRARASRHDAMRGSSPFERHDASRAPRGAARRKSCAYRVALSLHFFCRCLPPLTPSLPLPHVSDTTSVSMYPIYRRATLPPATAAAVAVAAPTAHYRGKLYRRVAFRSNSWHNSSLPSYEFSNHEKSGLTLIVSIPSLSDSRLSHALT